MIPSVHFERSGLKTSRLAFGTSRLHYVDSRERQRLLSAALDLGFRHIDTAPSYGEGLAERALGAFIKDRRSQIVLATKFGIPPDRIIAAIPALSRPLMGVRSVARKVGLWKSKWPKINAGGLRSSVELSLKRLGTDRFELLLLHEPSISRINSTEHVLEELLSLRQRGIIQHFGLAGEWKSVAEVVARQPELGSIIQTHESEWSENCVPDVTFGAIATSPQSAFGTVAVESDVALDRLRSALIRRPMGSVIVATTKLDHLHSLANVAS